MDNGLGIGARLEGMPFGFKVSSQFLVIIDFAVEHDDDRAVLVEHGLVTSLEINDAQPPVRKTDARRNVEAFIVRAAVNDRVGHLPDQCRVDSPFVAIIKDAGYATHASFSAVSAVPSF